MLAEWLQAMFVHLVFKVSLISAMYRALQPECLLGCLGLDLCPIGVSICPRTCIHVANQTVHDCASQCLSLSLTCSS